MTGLPADGSLASLRALRACREAVAALHPELPRSYIETWSILDHDALAIHHLIDAMDGRVAVFEIGTFVGVSAFHFATHPAVVRVVSVDPNPLVRDEINGSEATIGLRIEEGRLDGVHVLDVAEAVLRSFPEQRARIELKVGVVGAPGSAPAVAVPDPAALGADRLLAFIDGRHSRDAVRADLAAVLEARPETLVVLDDCRYRWGPFVQAGVAAFLESAPGRFHFQLLADRHAAFGRSNLGLVYASAHAAEMEALLTRSTSAFSRRFEILALLEREEDLAALVSVRSEELAARSAALTAASQELAHARAALSRIEGSRSWKLTAPLRRAWDALQRFAAP